MGNSPSYSSDSLKDRNSFFGNNNPPSNSKTDEQSSSNPEESKNLATKKPKSQQERVTFVLQKLKTLYPDYKEEKLLPFAETLADKNKLKDVYLHRDFSAAKKLQKKLDDTFVNSEIQQKETSKSMFSSASENAPVQEIISIENKNLEKENEEEENFGLSMNSNNNLNDTKIRVKLIVAETANTEFQKNIKKLLAPFINSFVTNGTKFGIFHISLGIGPWKIEWNSSSLCIPRAISGKAALLCADIEHITTLEKLDVVIDRLADVIVKWNTEMFYKESGSNPKKEKKGNCQQFIEEVLESLGVNLPDFPIPLKNYIYNMKQTGSAAMDFIVTPEFAEHFKIDSKNYLKISEKEENESKKSNNNNNNNNFKITFKTHRELDIFTRNLMEIDSDFQFSYKYEYYMLKSFDRAFWMRYLKLRESMQESKITEFAPLKSDDDGTLLCPFDDPEKFSFLEFKVQKPSSF